MRSMPMNIDMALTPIDNNAPFVLDLYHYRDQMAAGYFTFDEAGALDVHLPSYPTLASASAGANGAKDAQSQTGSASARYNDSLIREQQAALAQARLRLATRAAGFAHGVGRARHSGRHARGVFRAERRDARFGTRRRASFAAAPRR